MPCAAKAILRIACYIRANEQCAQAHRTNANIVHYPGRFSSPKEKKNTLYIRHLNNKNILPLKGKSAMNFCNLLTTAT